MNESASPPPMEMTNQFKREIVLAELKQWSPGEQCMFLTEALNAISFSLVKFMTTVCSDLSQKTTGFDSNSQFSSVMEDQANDIAYFNVLNGKTIDTKLKFLSLYLPLLKILPANRALNQKLKDAYNELIQNVLEECLMEHKYIQQCDSILIFASLHPIFDSLQKLSFQKWIELFQEVRNLKTTSTSDSENEASKSTNYIIRESSGGKDSTETPYNNILKGPDLKPLKNGFLNRQHLTLGRAVSSPGERTIQVKHNYNNSGSNVVVEGFRNNNESSFHSSNSLNIKNENDGMRNLPQWMKIIKLHKYTEFFAQMAYTDMVALDDKQLIAFNITLGARKKLLSCIDKLKERPVRLAELIHILDDTKCVINDSTIENILIELTEISMSPIEPNKSMPTTIDKSESYFMNNETQIFESSSNNTCQLILKLFEKIQNYLLKQNPGRVDGETELKELVKISLKIIDKLFLAKAFSDIQNLRLAKIRNKFNEKMLTLNTTSTSSPPTRPHDLLTKSSSSYAFTHSSKLRGLNSGNFNEWMEAPRMTNNLNPVLNSVNARQRIQNKTLSVPFHYHSTLEQHQQATEADISTKRNSVYKSNDNIVI